MTRDHKNWVMGAGMIALSLTLSGCFTFTARTVPYSGIGPPGYGDVQDPGGIHVETADYDLANAPKACVNNLAVFEAHLQVPDAPAMDLNKPVNAYVQEAGSARAAINAVQVELASLNTDLNYELAGRNPFDANARAASDDAIAYIEDGILLNEALAEALECRR